MPGMHMGLKDLRQHCGIVRDYLVCLRDVRDIENAQATLISQKRTALDGLPGGKNLFLLLPWSPLKRFPRIRLPLNPAWPRGEVNVEHKNLSFSNQRCARWYKALRSSPWMGGMMCQMRETAENFRGHRMKPCLCRQKPP